MSHPYQHMKGYPFLGYVVEEFICSTHKGAYDIYVGRNKEGKRAVIKKVIGIKNPEKFKAHYSEEIKIHERLKRKPNIAEFIAADEGNQAILTSFINGASLENVLNPESDSLDQCINFFEPYKNAKYRTGLLSRELGVKKCNVQRKDYYLIPEDRAVRITLGILKGLEGIHEEKVFHHDLWSNNVVIELGGLNTAYIVDFGLARFEERAGILTGSSSDRLGKEQFTAPEATEDKMKPDNEIFSVGGILYHMLTGKVYDRRQVKDNSPKAVGTYPKAFEGNEISVKVDQFVQDCLSKRATRPQTAREARLRLEKIYESIGGPQKDQAWRESQLSPLREGLVNRITGNGHMPFPSIDEFFREKGSYDTSLRQVNRFPDQELEERIQKRDASMNTEYHGFFDKYRSGGDDSVSKSEAKKISNQTFNIMLSWVLWQDRIDERLKLNKTFAHENLKNLRPELKEALLTAFNEKGISPCSCGKADCSARI